MKAFSETNIYNEMGIKMNQTDIPIYGVHAVRELIKTRKQDIEHIYFDKDKKNEDLFNLIKTSRKERLNYNLVPEIKLNSLSGSSRHQGVVAFCSIKPYSSPDELKQIISRKKSPLLLVAASVEDPLNLGAIIRSAVAFGVDAMLLERKNTVPLNASVARSSAGMIEHLAVGKPRNLEGFLKELLKQDFTIAGAHMTKGEQPDAADLTGPIILVCGGENRGIPPYLDKLCTTHLKIPMTGAAQSLNVSAASAVLMYECMRQRGFPESER
ncbi:23S rRNA (guanosine-2'-O-) -methyltransferase rlmB [Chitinispirillum alkaliphilum]|nr:23S rRNA (guanosine-2'-O-) -methyltransferase rlmB [Chitinispirillum alkaliphilum]